MATTTLIPGDIVEFEGTEFAVESVGGNHENTIERKFMERQQLVCLREVVFSVPSRIAIDWRVVRFPPNWKADFNLFPAVERVQEVAIRAIGAGSL